MELNFSLLEMICAWDSWT